MPHPAPGHTDHRLPVAPPTAGGYENGGPSARYDWIVDHYNQTGERFRIVGYRECPSD